MTGQVCTDIQTFDNHPKVRQNSASMKSSIPRYTWYNSVYTSMKSLYWYIRSYTNIAELYWVILSYTCVRIPDGCIRCILMYWMLIHRLNCKYIQNTRKYTVNTSTGLPPIFDFGENTKKRLIHGILSVFPMYMPFNTSSMYWKQAACIDTSNTA